MTEALIFDAVRTPRGKGKKDGSLHEITPIHLLKNMYDALRERNNLDTSKVDDVVLGVVTPVGEQGSCIARVSALYAGWNERVAGVTQNRFCASGLESESYVRPRRSDRRGWCRKYVALPYGLRWRRLVYGSTRQQCPTVYAPRYWRRRVGHADGL